VASYGSGSTARAKVTLISSATNKIVGTVTLPGHAHPVLGMGYSPLTQEMYVANSKNRAGSVSVISGTQLVETIKLDYAGPYAVKFDSADGYVWVTETGGEIAFINSQDRLVGTILVPSQTSPIITGMAYNPSNSRLYVATSYNNVVFVFNS
jgi:DNA-binding beta-propeller fold protein YncE